jgi:hypothetical protein
VLVFGTIIVAGMALSPSANAVNASRATLHPNRVDCDEVSLNPTGRPGCRPPDKHVHYVMIGTSITRKAKPQLFASIPHLTLDALDGRAWEIPGRPNGTTTWGAFVQHLPELRPKDWLIMETGRGDIPIAMNRTYMDKVVAALPTGVCLAWILPHTYYSTQNAEYTAKMATWNADMAALINSELSGVPCHAAVPWDSVVTFETQMADSATGLTADQLKAWEPCLYDGRHPTTFGAGVYATTIAVALHATSVTPPPSSGKFHWPRRP